MILLADVGNSRIKWVILENGEFRLRGCSSHGETGWAELAARQWGDLPRPARALRMPPHQRLGPTSQRPRKKRRALSLYRSRQSL